MTPCYVFIFFKIITVLFPFLLKSIPDLLKNANPLDGIPEKDYAQAIKTKEAVIMDINEEKIIEEIKRVFAAKVSSSDEPCCKCGGKSPMEMRWNVEEKDKPVEA